MTAGAIDLANVTFPTTYEVRGTDLVTRVKLLLEGHVQQWQAKGLLKATPNFGLAVANPEFAGKFNTVWDGPSWLVGYVVGWGPEAQRYICNAVRKLRPAAREGLDTLIMRQRGHLVYFLDEVPSAREGVFPWGDFPWGGAAFAGEGSTQQLVGVSALTEDEDDAVAGLVARFLRTETKKLEAAAKT